MVRNDSFDRHKDLGKNSEGRARLIHEPGAVGANIDCDYHIGAQRTRVTDRNVRDQSAVNQESPVSVAHRNVQCRQAATGANCEGQIAAVAQRDGSAGA